MSQFRPVTETDPKPDPMLIEYRTTPQQRDDLAIARLHVEAHKRSIERHRDPEGLTVTDASMADFLEARAAFGRDF